MHNKHYVVIKALSHKDAQEEVENFIQDFGDENNWREICGSIREDGDINSTGEGRYCPEEGISIEEINKQILESINSVDFYGEEGDKILKEVEAGTKKLSEINSLQWWSINKHAKHMVEVSRMNKEKFDVLSQSYKEYNYDDFGVTNLSETDYGTASEDKDAKLYVVIVDMHS